MTLELWGHLSALAMGLILGLLGAGGSILTVPIFIYLFGMPPSGATHLSLLVVGVCALVAMVGYLKERKVLPKVAVLFFIPAYVGILISRRGILPALPDSILKEVLIVGVFAVVMIAAGASMLRKRKSKSETFQLNIPRLVLQGLGVGLVTGFVGAGGGFLIVPALFALAGLEMKTAIGTSLLVIALNSLAGFFSSPGSIQDAPWLRLGIFLSIALAGIVLGLLLSKKISGERLKPAFGVFVLLMGAGMLIATVLGA